MNHWFVKHPHTGVTLLDVPAPDEETALHVALRYAHVRAVQNQFGTPTVHLVGQNGARS